LLDFYGGFGMGLFRKKGKMNIPPPPPQDGGSEEEKPDIPAVPASVPSGTHLPSELPEIKPAGKMMPAGPAETKKKKMPSMPEFPEIPKEEPSSMLEPEKEEPEEEMPPMPEEPHIPEELEPADVEGPKFVPAPSFQAIVAETDEIKSSLKHADVIFSSLNRLREDEEKEFEKWKIHLEDVQKKLEYVDQLIFEGE
jgi:hypothetical protein